MFFPKKWKFENILYLINSKNFRANEIIQILDSYNSLDEFISSQNQLFSMDLKNFDNILPIKDNQLELLEKYNAQIVTYWDGYYPKLLKEISSPPIFLIVLGQLQKSNSLSISVVGTRRPTFYGLNITKKFVGFFAENGIIITSGLAMGIDTTAHMTSIDKNGTTYAVLASGLDQVTSTTKAKIDKIIASGGAVMTEHLFGVSSKPGYFPQRNRIISGISKALLVIESGIKGGSMITANFAFEQNRDIFAIPNNIDAEKSKGCNYLIYKNMAIPALSPEQILKDLNIDFKQKKEEQGIIIEDKEEKLIFDLLNHEPLHIDAIAEKLNFSITDVMVKLLNLEFKGIVKQLPGKYFIKNY